MQLLSSLFALGLLLPAALAGPLTYGTPANRMSYPAGPMDITWDLGDQTLNLTQFMNLSVALWYYPNTSSRSGYLLDVLGAVPATDKQFSTNISNTLGPSGRYYRIFLNATPAGIGYSPSGLFALTGMQGTNATAMTKNAGIDGYAAAAIVNPVSSASATATIAVTGATILILSAIALAI